MKIHFHAGWENGRPGCDGDCQFCVMAQAILDLQDEVAVLKTKPKEKKLVTYWVNIYKDRVGDFHTSAGVFRTKQDAIDSSNGRSTLLSVVSIHSFEVEEDT